MDNYSNAQDPEVSKQDQELSAEISLLQHGNKAERGVAIALMYHGVDGGHHKTWVIDQMVQVLAGGAYGKLREYFVVDGEDLYDEGIAP